MAGGRICPYLMWVRGAIGSEVGKDRFPALILTFDILSSNFLNDILIGKVSDPGPPITKVPKSRLNVPCPQVKP